MKQPSNNILVALIGGLSGSRDEFLHFGEFQRPQTILMWKKDQIRNCIHFQNVIEQSLLTRSISSTVRSFRFLAPLRLPSSG